jgi:hypothetical protein
MLSIRSLVENLNLFEGDKILLELKYWTSALHTALKPRRAAKALSEITKSPNSHLEVG